MLHTVCPLAKLSQISWQAFNAGCKECMHAQSPLTVRKWQWDMLAKYQTICCSSPGDRLPQTPVSLAYWACSHLNTRLREASAASARIYCNVLTQAGPALVATLPVAMLG